MITMIPENRDRLEDVIETLKTLRMGSTVGELNRLDAAIGMLMEIMTPEREE